MPVLPIRMHPVPAFQLVDVAVRKSHFVLVCMECFRITWRCSRLKPLQPSKQWVHFSTTFLVIDFSSVFSLQILCFANHPINTQNKKTSASHMRYWEHMQSWAGIYLSTPTFKVRCLYCNLFIFLMTVDREKANLGLDFVILVLFHFNPQAYWWDDL